MSIRTMITVGDLFAYNAYDPSLSGEMLISEVIRVETDGTIVCAETLNTDPKRTAAYMDADVFEEFEYLGTVRPDNERADYPEVGDLFVYTYEGPGGAGHSGTTFVLELTHTPTEIGDAVFGQIHFPGAYADTSFMSPYRFDRKHLRDFRYAGKADDGTRDGIVGHSVIPTEGGSPVTPTTPEPTTGTDASA